MKINKVGAEPTEMSLKCKGQFDVVTDKQSYTLSELLELVTLPCTVTLPQQTRQTLNMKSGILKLLNYAGGTLTLQREVASEFFVASPPVHQGKGQQQQSEMVLVMSKNANCQFQVASDRESDHYQSVLESFGSVDIKWIPQVRIIFSVFTINDCWCLTLIFSNGGANPSEAQRCYTLGCD